MHAQLVYKYYVLTVEAKKHQPVEIEWMTVMSPWRRIVVTMAVLSPWEQILVVMAVRSPRRQILVIIGQYERVSCMLMLKVYWYPWLAVSPWYLRSRRGKWINHSRRTKRATKSGSHTTARSHTHMPCDVSRDPLK